MQIFSHIYPLKTTLMDWRSKNQIIALVPTMGGLHRAHLALVEAAQKKADRVVVSIFVNPMQFAAHEDFDTYPRSIQADLAALEALKVDIAFIPDAGEIYPSNESLNQAKFKKKYQKNTYLFEILCGRTRPHFFYGVLQVVQRLFEIVAPDVAVFGQKDYQQLKIIQKFTQGVEIISVAVVRENDGLAISTRNQYLNASERMLAPQLYKTLSQLLRDELDKQSAIGQLQHHFKLDYLQVLDADTLSEIDDNSSKIAILCAVFLGKNRLIDNIVFRR